MTTAATTPVEGVTDEQIQAVLEQCAPSWWDVPHGATEKFARAILALATPSPGKADAERDAARWRAFINCARIRFFGWAGYEDLSPYGKPNGNYRHFGAEFWTIHEASTVDKEKAAEILNGFADATIQQERDAKP